ncbi:MAG: GntR family transcriptional regulator [Eubacterium sp.]|nr:GntR family transcriptional regulator [Eubacterium sp.]
MAWHFENGRPIYTQLLEQIEQKIISGEYSVGQKLPSVRELAMEAAVNPNTMQRAMAELEQRGLVVTNRTAGRIVTENQQILADIKEERALECTRIYVTQMKEMGFEKKEIVALIEKGE